MLEHQLNDYKDINPDTIYKPGSMTFFYIPRSGNLYVQPHPTSHRDMMDENDDLFADVYQGKNLSISRNKLASRGQILIHTDSVLGRIGALGDNFCIVFWTKPSNEIFGNFLSKLYEKYPTFRNIQAQTLIIFPNEVHQLADFLGGQPNPQRVVKLKRPKQKNNKKYTIGHQDYTISDLQNLRASLHTKGHSSGALSILCHPDLQKYPELAGYRPSTCQPDSTIRPTHPSNWRREAWKRGIPYTYSYGESMDFANWLIFQDIFKDSLQVE